MCNELYVSNQISVSFTDYPSITGTALIYYIYGCDRNCPGCQNKDLQSKPNVNDEAVLCFKDPKLFAEFLVNNDMKMNRNKHLIIFQGGDPFFKYNIDFILESIYYTRELCGVEKLNFCIYTGGEIIDFLNYISNSNCSITHWAMYDQIEYKESKEYIYDINNLRINKNIEIKNEKFAKAIELIKYIKCGKYDETKPNINPGSKLNGYLYLSTTNQSMYKLICDDIYCYLSKISKNGVVTLI